METQDIIIQTLAVIYFAGCWLIIWREGRRRRRERAARRALFRYNNPLMK